MRRECRQAGVLGAEQQRRRSPAVDHRRTNEFGCKITDVAGATAGCTGTAGGSDDRRAAGHRLRERVGFACRLKHVTGVNRHSTRLLAIEVGSDDRQVGGSHVLHRTADGADIGAATRSDEHDAHGQPARLHRLRIVNRRQQSSECGPSA